MNISNVSKISIILLNERMYVLFHKNVSTPLSCENAIIHNRKWLRAKTDTSFNFVEQIDACRVQNDIWGQTKWQRFQRLRSGPRFLLFYIILYTHIIHIYVLVFL